MQRFLVAALAVAALLVPAIGSRPAPAQASGLCDLGIFSLFCPEDAPPIPDPVLCEVQNVSVKVTDAAIRSYTFHETCPGKSFDASADVNLHSHQITERLSNAGWTLLAQWTNCSGDPWLAPGGSRTCAKNPAVSANPNNGGFDVSNSVVPFSAQNLSAKALQALTDALSNAPTPLVLDESSTIKPKDCALCSVLGGSPAPAPAPAPALPDLKVPTLGGETNLTQGTTSVYSIGVSNAGTRPPAQVQVSIQVSGAVQYVGMTQTPSGWDCSGTGPILCVGPLGGSGDPVQDLAVSFGVQVRGAKAGIGSVSAAVDSNGLIRESDETNNAKTLAITVK